MKMIASQSQRGKDKKTTRKSFGADKKGGDDETTTTVAQKFAVDAVAALGARTLII